jgi:hypothetical protein
MRIPSGLFAPGLCKNFELRTELLTLILHALFCA